MAQGGGGQANCINPQFGAERIRPHPEIAQVAEHSLDKAEVGASIASLRTKFKFAGVAHGEQAVL